MVHIQLPALRERVSDIEELSRHFLNKASVNGLSFNPGALEKLKSHFWPGNIRELKNVIERAVVIAKGRVVSEDDIRLIDLRSNSENSEVLDLNWHQAIAQLERKLLIQALKEAEGNRSEAARKLGIQRQLLYAKMKEHQIQGT